MEENETKILNFLKKKTSREKSPIKEIEKENYYNTLIQNIIGSSSSDSEENEEIDYEKEWIKIPKSEIKTIKETERENSFIDLNEIQEQIEKENKEQFTKKYKNYTPYDFFSKFIDEKLYEIICKETIKYYKLKNKNKVNLKTISFFTIENLKKYLACMLTMGIVRFPRIQLYWNSNPGIFEYDFLKSIISRNGWCLFNSYLHFPSETNDNVGKINTIINYINDKWYEYRPESFTFSIDETMVPFKGRLKLRQFMPKKPTKYGIKIFGISNSEDSYVLKWLLYPGAGYPLKNVIISMASVLKKNDYVFFDSYFTTRETINYLDKKGIFYVGSVRKNRKGFPKFNNHNNDILFPYYKLNNMLLVQYPDNKLIIVVSNCFTKPIDVVYNKKKNQKNENKIKPFLLEQYSKYARGIDKNNQLTSFYFANKKSIKWYKKFFIYLLDTCITNAYILYKKVNNNKMELLDFKINIIYSLKGENRKVIKTPINVDPNKRLVGNHFIKKIKERKDCILCSDRKNKRKMTYLICSICRVHLCLDCFETFHTIKDVKNYKKLNNIN